MKNQFRWASTLMLLVTLIMMGVTYQNCGKFGTLEMKDPGSYELYSLSSCLKQSEYDACIFNKNPWNQEGANTVAIQKRVPAAAPEMQNMGIQLPSQMKIGQSLDSPKLRINSRLKTNFDGKWKVPYALQSQSTVHHLMAYYWSNRALEFWQVNMNQNLFDNQNVTIDTDAGITGWSTTNKTLYLKLDEGVKSHALDASAIVHLITEAAIDLSSRGKIYIVSDTSKFTDCGSPGEPRYTQDCCASFRGCSTAVTSGISDFMVGQVFKRSPAVAEGISSDPLGMKICGVHRNPILNADLTATAAFESCRSENRAGQVFVMGAFYASLWYSAQKSAAQSGIDEGEFQEFLQSLVTLLDGNDDFITVLQKIKTTDADPRFNGRFSIHFENEYKRRGL